VNWISGGRGSGEALLSWLKKDEWKHMTLSSRLREAGGIPRFGKIANGRLWIRRNRNHVTGALYISRYGVVLPAFNPGENDAEDSHFLKKAIQTRKKNLFSIIGMENRVLRLEEYLNQTASDSVSYRMFIRGGPIASSQQEEPPELSIHKAEISDFDKLWKLEKAYQIEEVLREGNTLDIRSSRLHFQHTLRNQTVYYAALAGRPVAKAGTNARGYTFSQIGGVFVIPELRGYGFGTAVMNHLLSAISESGQQSCLFVKRTNLPALKLYENLGFKDMGAFRISYYH